MKTESCGSNFKGEYIENRKADISKDISNCEQSVFDKTTHVENCDEIPVTSHSLLSNEFE